MKVSIITATYNSQETIATALDSLLKQDYPDIECVIIDGKSVDSTLEIVKKKLEERPNFNSIVISESDTGIYNALNKGLNNATGDIIGFLHSDDLYPSRDIISKVHEVFVNDPNLQAVYGDLKYLSYDLKSVHRNWISGKYYTGNFLKGWMPPHPTFFVKKEVYEEFGLFNESFTISADYELMLRFIHKHKIKLKYLPEVLVHMRTGGVSNQNFKSRIQANKEDRKAWRINGLKPKRLTLIKKPLLKLTQFFKK